MSKLDTGNSLVEPKGSFSESVSTTFVHDCRQIILQRSSDQTKEKHTAPQSLTLFCLAFALSLNLNLISQVGCLYGRILNDVESTDLTQ